MFPLSQDTTDGEEDGRDGNHDQAGEPVMSLRVEVADDDRSQCGDQVPDGLNHPGQVSGIGCILGLKAKQGHCQNEGGGGSHPQEEGDHAVVGK